MKNFFQRTLTGIIYVSVILCGILFNSYLFLILFSLVTGLCLYEFYGLMNKTKDAKINRTIHALGGLSLFVASHFCISSRQGLIVFLPYLIYILGTFIASLYKKNADPLNNLAFVFLGQIYIAFPLSLLNLLTFDMGMATYTYILVLALFVFIWINDTGAYLTGVRFGKHRLFERISPKKSWEGFFGGLIFSVSASLVFAHCYPAIPQIHWVGMAATVVVFATWGDLVESLIKRSIGVKDSGNCLPGHGGFLDRFDSLFLAVYGLLLYFFLLVS